MTSQEQTAQSSRDLLARPFSAFLWWGLPLLAGVSTNVLPISGAAATCVWAAAFAWMGVGCALNALRCRRLHCYIAAPVLLLGAAAAAAVGLGLAPLGPSTRGYVINATVALALLTFLVEPVWGRYRAR